MIREQLADAIADGDVAVLQFDHANGDAVDIKHEVWPPFQPSAQRDFFHDHEVVPLRVFPVDEFYRFGHLARFDFHRHAVAQHGIDGPVVIVEAVVRVFRFNAQQVDGAANLRHGVTGLDEVGAEQVFLDVAVVRTV